MAKHKNMEIISWQLRHLLPEGEVYPKPVFHELMLLRQARSMKDAFDFFKR
jgi:hypothetical protein